MVESTVIFSVRICFAEPATLSAGACAFAVFSSTAGVQSAATAEMEINQRKGFFTRARRYATEQPIFQGCRAVHVVARPANHFFRPEPGAMEGSTLL